MHCIRKKTDKAKIFKDEWYHKIKHTNNGVNKLIDELKQSLISSRKG
jgi:hypothetical protein